MIYIQYMMKDYYTKISMMKKIIMDICVKELSKENDIIKDIKMKKSFDKRINQDKKNIFFKNVYDQYNMEQLKVIDILYI